MAHILIYTLCGTMLSACTNIDGTQLVRLAPCSAEGSVFEDIAFDQWASTYHQYNSDVIEAHLEGKDDASSQKLKCTAEDYAGLSTPSSSLVTVAKLLPAWNDPKKIQSLSEADMASVLLEFLRVYECSLLERRENLIPSIQEESDADLNIGTLNEKKDAQIEMIEKEIKISRPTLERTLEAIGGYDRFRPLMSDIECIKRSSLDLRNVLGLTAEASACLPRATGAKGSLFDPPNIDQ